MILLVRHAKAGDRNRWAQADHLRPVSRKGRLQAEALPDLFAPFGVTRILTSPYLRCVQTVEPLAALLGLEVEESAALAEGAGRGRSLALMAELAAAAGTAVCCTHGDVMFDVVHPLVETLGLPSDFPGQKGATWVLEGGDYPPERARYLAPPLT